MVLTHSNIDTLENVVCTCAAVIFKADKKIDRLLSSRMGSLTRTITREWSKNLKVLDLAIRNRFKGTGQPKTKDSKFVKTTTSNLFSKFATPLKSRILKDVSFIYRSNKKDFVKTHELEPVKKAGPILPSFSADDVKTVDRLADQHLISSNLFYEGNLSGEVVKIIEQTFKEGRNFTQTGEILRERLGKKLGLTHEVLDTVLKPEGYNGNVQSYFKGLGETTLNRARTFSSITALSEAEFEQYVISNPSPVAQICKQMAGRVFSVPQGVEQMNDILSQENPDGIKNVAGWKRNLSSFGIDSTGQKLTNTKFNSGLANAGLALPPYHMRCATTVEPA